MQAQTLDSLQPKGPKNASLQKMTPLQEGLLGATIIGIAIYSEPLAIKIGYLDADFTSRLFDAAPPAETWGLSLIHI